jgi:predicted permease
MFDTLIQDLSYAWRSLRRTPGFTLMSIVTLALGIGATTAIFTVVNAALFKPLPYPEQDRLLTLTLPEGGSQSGQVFLFMRERSTAFAQVAAQGGGTGWNLTGESLATFAKGTRVSAGYFAALGAAPALGREFTRVEDEPQGPDAVVISDALWRRAFGGRPDVLGTAIRLGGVPHTVVGIMPATFRSIPDTDLWTTLRTTLRDTGQNYTVLGRLRDDGSAVRASTELDSLRRELRREFPQINERRVNALIWKPYRDAVGRNYRQPLFVLLGAVAFLLLIACVNVAGLQLTRAVARRRELRTRAALGGGQRRLAQQVLSEAVLLALLSAVVGIAIAVAGTELLLGLVSQDAASDLLTGQPANIDWRVLAMTLGTALAAGIFFGTAPALATSRLNLSVAEGARHTMSKATAWFRRSLVIVEVALSVVLLVGAGLLIRTLMNLNGAELGFDPGRVMVGRMSVQGSVADGAELGALLEQTLARIRQAPGITGAAAANHVPVERGLNLALDPPAGSRVTEVRSIDWRYITSDYFDVFNIQLRAGRRFEARDTTGSSPVTIVNEAFARAYFGRVDVTGQTISLVPSFGDTARQIVGVVADVKARSGSGWTRSLTALGGPAAPAMYVPAGQLPRGVLAGANRFFNMTWALRTSGSSFDQRPIEAAVRAVNPTLPFITFEPMTAVVSRDIELQRLVAALLMVFAGLAVLLAAMGLYGLLSYGATQRRREVSIRMALGATAVRVLRAFMSEGLILAAAGMLLGIVGAVFASRVLTILLFGVTPLDGATFVGVAALLLIVSAVAVFLPALKAARTDPAQVLRAD